MKIQHTDISFSLGKLLMIIFMVGVGINTLQAQAPPPVALKYITVNPSNNEITVYWNKSGMPSVTGYSIYAKDTITNTDGFWQGSVNSILTTNWTDPTTNADFQSESYTVMVKTPTDSSVFADYHSTVHLTHSFDSCRGAIALKWTPYIGWDNVLRYEIWVDDGSGQWMEATVAGHITDFKHTTLKVNTWYTYYIVAVSGSNTYQSKSNNVMRYTAMPRPPDYLNANYANVKAENQIELNFAVVDNDDIVEYKILRADAPLGDYKEVHAVSSLNNTIYNVGFVDNINTDEVHYYKLEAYNYCNVAFAENSNIIANILAEVEPLRNMKNRISWTNHFNWKGTVDYYSVYRIIDNDTALIGYTDYGDTVFVDNIETYVEDYHNSPYFDGENPPAWDPKPTPYLEQPILSGHFCYLILAHEKNNPHDINQVQISNISCTVKVPVVWIPSAFSPSSIIEKNRYFRPFITYGGLSSYKMRIFDRNGFLVWETDELKEGWDGRTDYLAKYDDKGAPTGMYIYIINYTDGNNKEYEKQGTVFLIK